MGGTDDRAGNEAEEEADDADLLGDEPLSDNAGEEDGSEEVEGAEDSEDGEEGEGEEDADSPNEPDEDEIERTLREFGNDPRKLAKSYREALKLSGRKGQQAGDYKKALESQGYTFDDKGNPVPPQTAGTGAAGTNQPNEREQPTAAAPGEFLNTGKVDDNGLEVWVDDLGLRVFTTQQWDEHAETVGERQAMRDELAWKDEYQRERQKVLGERIGSLKQQQQSEVQQAEAAVLTQIQKATGLDEPLAKSLATRYRENADKILANLPEEQRYLPGYFETAVKMAVFEDWWTGALETEAQSLRSGTGARAKNGATRIVPRVETEGGASPRPLSRAQRAALKAGLPEEEAARYASDDFRFDD